MYPAVSPHVIGHPICSQTGFNPPQAALIRHWCRSLSKSQAKAWRWAAALDIERTQELPDPVLEG